jgi:hypothetical protein
MTWPPGVSLGWRSLVGGFLGLAACAGSDGADPYVIVTIEARPAVHDASAVTVGLTNAGTTRSDSLALRDHDFPVTLSISAPERTGELGITVEATDEAGLVVGLGSVTTTVEAATAELTLEPADFVVNTDYANDQFPSNDFEAAGFQLAALPDGTWTAAFRDASQSPTVTAVTILGRRFDGTGRPVSTQLAAGTGGFPLSSVPTTRGSTPAIAASLTTTLAVWDFFAVDSDPHGVACRALDLAGRATAAQAIVAPDAADVVSLTALASGDFLAAWSTVLTDTHVIRSLVIKPDCTAPAPPETVSTPTDDAHRASLAANADRSLFAWIVEGDLHVRVASATGMLVAAEQILVHKTATDEIVHARVAPSAANGDGGFVVVARWAFSASGDGPGRIELFRTDATGSLIGNPAVITDRSGSDFDNAQSFGLASRPDGTVLVAWHGCGALGDTNLCGVFGRFVRDTGEPITDAFVIPTTTKADQQLPSVIALDDAFVALWSDASATPPDASGTAVRARLLYPPPAPVP